MGDRYNVSDVNKQILYIDANLYGWAMSQYLPTGEFEKLPLETKITQIPKALRAITI